MPAVARDRNPDATKLSHYVGYASPLVRIPSRSRRSSLGILALGAFAAVVAFAGDAQPARSASAPAASRVDEAVRDLDFATIAQPGVTCTGALTAGAPGSIGITGGQSALLDEATVARLTVDPEVLYADLDGDGGDEAVVQATCSYGANGEQDAVQVWSVVGRLPVLVDTVIGAPDAVADGSRFPPPVVDVAVEGGELVVRFGVYDDDAPHCCPSSQAAVTYQLDRGLTVVGDPEVGPLA